MTVTPFPVNYDTFPVMRGKISIEDVSDLSLRNQSRHKWKEAEKPEEVLLWLLQMVCQEGDTEVAVSETLQVSILTRSNSFPTETFLFY